MTVYIIESPNKVKKIREITGDQVYATAGHFLDLPSNDMGIDLDTYEHTFVINPEKAGTLDKIIKACDGQKVYIATDPDREGYAIGTMIYERIQSIAECWRLELREITKKGIEEALKASVPFEDTNSGLYKAFLGRRLGDRLSGYILSPITCKALNGKYSVGRVQSPAIRLVVDRDLEIDNFKASPFYTLSAELSVNEKTFTAQFDGYPDDKSSFTNKDHAQEILEALCKITKAIVVNVDKKVANRRAKAPFTTVELQASASIALSFSPEKSMQLAQGLYESGLITYHRTDSVRLSDEFLTEAIDFIRSNFGEEYIPEKPITHKSKNSQSDAHEGIRPTHLHALNELSHKIKDLELTKEHEALYELIFKRAVASTMCDATADTTKYQIEIGNMPFKATGSVPKFDGWTRLYNDLQEDQEQLKDQVLPLCEQDQELKKVSETLSEKTTKAPGRYSEASLVKELEKRGIGRPSTYASIIATILKRNYVRIDKKRLISTPDGKALIDYLNQEHSWIIDYDTTAHMEEYLDKVENHNNATYIEFLKNMHEKMHFLKPEIKTPRETKLPSEKQLSFALNVAQKKNKTLPDICTTDSYELSKWLDKYTDKPKEAVGTCKCGGEVKEWDKSFQCQTCKSTIWKVFLEKKITKSQAIKLLQGNTVTLSGLKSKSGNEFDAKGSYSDGKINLIFGDKK